MLRTSAVWVLLGCRQKGGKRGGAGLTSDTATADLERPGWNDLAGRFGAGKIGEMALLIRGKTRCPISNRIIGETDEAVCFPAFIAAKADPLWPFSDAPFHRPCFDAWEYRADFQEKSQSVLGQYRN